MVDELTEEQIAEFKEAFALFDKNGEGLIKSSKLRSALRSLGLNISESEIQDIILEMDPESTGNLSFPDFQDILVSQLQNTDTEDEIREAFRVYDKNGDGFITASEARTALLNVGEKLNDEEVDEMMREIDVDGEDPVDYEDFITTMATPKP